MMSRQNDVIVHLDERSVEWWVAETPRGARIQTPWAELWVGDSGGRGQEVWVEATEAFDLVLHTNASSFFEHIQTGRHRLLLTILDRTDVQDNRPPFRKSTIDDGR